MSPSAHRFTYALPDLLPAGVSVIVKSMRAFAGRLGAVNPHATGRP